MRSKCALYVFFSLLLLFFCSKSDETYTIETKDGVKYVHNHAPAWGDTLKVALEFVQKIGELDTEDENYMFYLPTDMARDDQGNIYVVDAGNYRIQKFDANGKYLVTFGRQGQGPSEFSLRPWTINFDTEWNMYIAVQGVRNIQILTPEGKEIKRIRFSFTSDGFGISRSGNLIIPYRSSPITYVDGKPISEIEQNTALIGLFDHNGSLLKEIGKIQEFKDINITKHANSNFIEVDSDGNIYLNFRFQNRIEKYSPEGELLWKADRPLDYELSYKLEERKIEMPDGSIYKSFLPRFTFVSFEIGIDHKGHIWVPTVTKQGKEGEESEYKFEILDNDGILLGRIPLPEKSSNHMRIFHDRLFFIGAENMFIYEYKIVEK